MAVKVAVFKKIFFIGGGEIYTKNLINDLNKNKISVKLVTNNPKLSKSFGIKNIIAINSLKEVQKRKEILLFVFLWPIDALKYFFVLLRLKKENFNIVILQDLNEKILVTPLAKLVKVKPIWIEHTTWEPYLINHPFFFLIRYNLKLANKVICPSKFLFDQVSKYCPQGKALIINTGILLKKITKNKKSANNFYTISRISAEKGLDVLIKALPHVNNKKVIFNIIGDGPAKNSLLELSLKLGVADRINFCGSLKDPYSIVEKDSILILPSRQENFSLVLLEALSAGMPIIASDVGGNKEIISEEENGYLFKNEDYKELADKINFVLNNKEKLEIIKKNNLKKYKFFFTNKIMIKKIINLIKSV